MALRGTSSAAGNDFSLVPSILSRAPSGNAPDNILFGAIATNAPGVSAPTGGQVRDPRLTEVTYAWDFGDGSYIFGSIGEIITDQNNANVAYGPRADHTYYAAGTYTVTVYAFRFDSGTMYTATTTFPVTVGAADYSGDRTYWIDPDGSTVGMPENAMGPYTTYASALAATAGAVNPARLLFNSLKTHNSGEIGRFESNMPSILITSSNTTSPASVTYTGTNGRGYFVSNSSNPYDSGGNKQVIFDAVSLPGAWDETTESGEATRRVRVYLGQAGGQSASYLLMTRLTAPGWSTVIEAQTLTANRVAMSNCNIPSFRKYSQLIEALYWTTRGCFIGRNRFALSGGPKDDTHNDHGCVRGSGGHTTVLGQCKLFSRCGWFATNFSYLGTNLFTNQPCGRFNTGQAYGSFYGIAQNYMEGGYSVLSFRPNNSGDTIRAVAGILIEMNQFVCGWMTQQVITCCHTNLKIRNNVANFANADRTHGTNTIQFLIYNVTNNNPQTTENLAGPVDILCNTVINRLSDGNAVGNDASMVTWYSNGGNAVTGTVTEDGNILYEPEIAAAPYTNIDLTSNADALGVENYEHAASPSNVEVPNTGTPLATPTLAIPTAGSTVKSRVGDPLTELDFAGNQRSTTDCFGAHFI